MKLHVLINDSNYVSKGDLFELLVDLVDETGKVPPLKFDEMIRKIKAGKLTSQEVKMLVTSTKNNLTTIQKGILGEVVSEYFYKKNPAKVVLNKLHQSCRVIMVTMIYILNMQKTIRVIIYLMHQEKK